MSTVTEIGESALVEPGRGAGLLDVARHGFLLRLLVRKELRVRYRGSVLGLAWSYVKPGVQFGVYFFVMGVFLQLNRALPKFAVYLFAGMVVMTYFGEAFGNATRSVVWNAPLVNKIYLPRELFPVASVWVALVHFVPQVAILLVGALVAGWIPSPAGLAALVLAWLIVTALALGLGLAAAAANVFFRDAENVVDLLLLLLTWASPVLYPWNRVAAAFSGNLDWLWQLYLANPLTVAVQLMQRAFWSGPHTPALIPQLWPRAGAAVVLSLVVLAAGQAVFRRLDGRFAQEL